MHLRRDFLISWALVIALSGLSYQITLAFSAERKQTSEAGISYSTQETTSADVIATISCPDPITIVNNDGLRAYTFSENGLFTFVYEDMHGQQKQLTAVVNNIDKSAPIAILGDAPDSQTDERSISLSIYGIDVAAYRYSLDDEAYSQAVPSDQPLQLRDLEVGRHTIAVIASDSVGNWQEPEQATSFSWEIFYSDDFRSRSLPLENSPKAIEISIEHQHLWAYEGKELVFHTAITSGARGMDTELGSFAISQMHKNKWFDGGFFSTYWMRFNKGMGIHDATWRDQFGTEDYKWRGSHGCVNTPYSAAEWLFSWADIGTPVLVF